MTRKKGLYTSEALGSQGFTAISACRSDETDFETTDDDTKPIGSLTYALCRALSTANDKTTYRDLYECITSIMRSRGIRQTPQLEGPLDQTVLGNGVIQPSKYIAVQVEDGSAYLQAGTLMGIGAGSKVAIFAPGTNDFAQGAKLGEVTLTAPDITKALIEVPGKTAQELDGARALVTQIAYRESPLKVNLTRMKAHPQYAGIRARLNEMKSKSLVDIVDSDTGWDIQVCPARHICDTTVVKAPTRGMDQRWHIEVLPAAHSGPNTARKVTLRGADPSAKDTVVLLRGDSTFLGAPQSLRVQGSDERIGLTALGNSPDLPHKIEQALTRETRYRILSSLPAKNSDSRIHIEFRVITCEGTPDPNQPGFFHWKRDTGELSPARGTLPEVKVGTLFRIELCNTGTIPAHVVLVDLDPEGGISPLWPNSTVGQLGNDDNLIRPSKIMDHREWQPLMAGAGSQDYALWTFTEPIGSETFTAIATPEFADFGPLFDLPAVDRESTPGQRGPGPRELNSPLGKLFASITTRAAPASSGVPNTWQATAVHIQVKPN